MRRKEGDEVLPAAPLMVGEVLRRSHSELSALRTRREQIQRRMQALRLFLVPAPEERSPGQRPGYPPSVLLSNPRSGETRLVDHDDRSKLRRACRIALMESAEPQTCHDVYERIKKRQSFPFYGFANPLQVVNAELDAMTRDGRIACSPDSEQKRWHTLGAGSHPQKIE